MTRTPRLSRRQLVLTTTAAAMLAPGMVACGDTSAPDLPNDGDAYRPWRDWNAAQTGPGHLVHAAILAANAHDTQPWQFCVAADRIDLFADERRNLGAMDPRRREMHISLGCAVENLCIAAQAQGLSPRVAVDPGSVTPAAGEAGRRHTATIMLDRAPAETSPLLAAIRRRHTNRGPYDADRVVPADAVARLRAIAGEDDGVRLILLETAARADFSAATVAATEAIIADKTMIADSDAWFRASDAEIAAHRDGPTLYAAGLSPFKLVFARLLPSVSPERSHRGWLDNTRDVQLATAPMFGLIAVRDLYNREQAIRAGRLWQRLHLQGTLLGLGMQPLNQLPETVDREAQLGKPPATAKLLGALAGDAAWQPTFAFRMGWPTRAAYASPRRALNDVIVPDGCKT